MKYGTDKLIARSCDAMCDEEVWSKKDHKLLVDTIDHLKDRICDYILTIQKQNSQSEQSQ